MNETAREVYAFVKAYIEENRFSPTQQEIADACMLAKSTVKYNLDKLEDAGLIRVEYAHWRGIRLLGDKR
jgi:DNA-binding MarR family transcriptional regulator